MRRISGVLALVVILCLSAPGPVHAAGLETCADWLVLNDAVRQGFIVGFIDGQGYAGGYIARALNQDLERMKGLVMEHAPQGRVRWLVDEVTLVCREARRPREVEILPVAYEEAVRRIRRLAAGREAESRNPYEDLVRELYPNAVPSPSPAAAPSPTRPLEF